MRATDNNLGDLIKTPDMTWLWEGVGSLACIALAVFLAVKLFRGLRAGYGFQPSIFVGLLASLGFAIWWGIDGTNRLWPELRPYTIFGVLAMIVAGFFVFNMASD